MNTELVKWAFPWVFPPIVTFLAAYIGIVYGLKQIKVQKQLDFCERQLREFYSPLLGCRNEIKAKTNARINISSAANVAWQEMCAENEGGYWDSKKGFEPYQKIIEYDNNQFANESFTLYKKMLAVFRDNYWLAEPDTRKWHMELCEFVELWKRWLSGTIPADVIEKMGHSEGKLLPFYGHLEKQTDILRNQLSGEGNVWRRLMWWRG